MGSVDVGKDLQDLENQLSEHGVKVYNQLFIDQLFNLSPSFESASTVDFSQSGPARDAINTLVSDKTVGKIKEILDEGAISAATKLVIINIVNFKGVWGEKFKKRNTRLAPFYLSADEFVDTNSNTLARNFLVPIHQTKPSANPARRSLPEPCRQRSRSSQQSNTLFGFRRGSICEYTPDVALVVPWLQVSPVEPPSRPRW